MNLRNYFLTGFFLVAIGTVGGFFLISSSLPTLGPRWLFFFLFTLLICGFSIPITAFLNRRFPSNPPADGKVIVRQAIFIALYGSILAWLQLGRVLNGVPVFFLGAGLIVIEILIRLFERSRWQPMDKHHE